MNGMKKVLVVFLVCFLALITYMAYFTVFQAPTIADRSDNKRYFNTEKRICIWRFIHSFIRFC